MEKRYGDVVRDEDLKEKAPHSVDVEVGNGSPEQTIVDGRGKLGVAAHRLKTWGVEARGT